MLQRSIDYLPHDPRATSALYPVPARHRAPEGEDLLGILRGLRRNLRLIAACALVGTALSTAVVFTMTQQYKASVSIYVDPRRTQLLKDRDVVGAPGPGTDTSIVESEAEIMKSPALMRRVAEQLNLKNDDEFSSTSLIGQVKRIILLPLRLLLGSSGGGDPLAGVAAALSKKVEAKRRNLTYVIELNGWSEDATKSARIANTVAKLYLEDQVAARSAVASGASKWLSQQAEEMRNRVTASEIAYEKYKAESGLFSSGGEALSDRQVGQLNDQLIQTRAKAAEARAKFEQLKEITPDKLQSAAASPDVLQSTVVSNLRAQYAEVTKRQAEMSARYGSQHPQSGIIQAQRNDIAAQITAEIGRIVASAKTEYEMASSRQRSLEASLDELKERAAQLNQASVRLRELEREAQANRELFQTFLSRAKEATAQIDTQLLDSRIVSAASVPIAPAYPPRLLIVAVGFFGSFGLGVALAFARDVLDKGLRSADQIETRLGLLSLASIPLVDGPGRRLGRDELRLGDTGWLRLPAQETRRAAGIPPKGAAMTAARLAGLVLDQPDSAFAESIRSLTFALKHAAIERGISVVLVTSALPGEGKSTVAANLARAAAANDRVLLIDGDLRHPTLAKSLGIRNSSGVADVLTGRSDLSASVREDPRSGLYVIAGTTRLSGSDAVSLLSSEQMNSLITLAREAFDLVIIDAAPLLPIADSRMLIEQVDGVVMVVASGQTSRDAVTTAMRESPGVEDKIVGVVLNRAVDDFDRYYRDQDVDPAHKVRPQ